MKIVAYKVLKNELHADLTVEVNKAIKEGWQPLGGVSHCPTTGIRTSNAYDYIQAMVKYESN